jgi:tRNA dimethylallyltransferase
VARVFEVARREGRRPVIVGGTGLYFKTLTEGLSPIPPIPDDVRAHWRREAEEMGVAHLHDVLTTRDAEMGGRLASGDTQRVVRALEVLDATGISLAEWQRRPREAVLNLADTIPLVVSIERDELARRIDGRFAEMIEEGGLEEALQLKALDLDPSRPLMTALGVRPVLRHLDGELSVDEAIAAGQLETRQYAKRQVTWARGNMIAWRAISTQEIQQSTGDFVSFIQAAH